MENLFDRINKLALFFIVYSLIFITLISTLGYTLPFVLAILFALMLQAPTRYLMYKFKLKDSLASLITTFLFFTIIIVLLIWMVTSLASEVSQLTVTISSYAASKTGSIYNMVEKLQNYFNDLDPNILNSIKNSLASSFATITKSTANLGVLIVSALMKLVSSIPYVLMVIVFTLITTYFFTKDLTKSGNKILNSLFSREADRIVYIFTETKKMLVNYIKSYMFIIFITFLVTFIGFWGIGVNYYLVLSIVCAVFDLLPILGIATIYLPVSILFFINGKPLNGTLILVLYALVSVIRQIVEPKIVSSSLGLHPVAVLAAIFIGLKVNGLSGMFFFMFLVVFYNIFKKVNVL